MRKLKLILFICTGLLLQARANNNSLDSLKRLLERTTSDTSKATLLIQISENEQNVYGLKKAEQYYGYAIRETNKVANNKLQISPSLRIFTLILVSFINSVGIN